MCYDTKYSALLLLVIYGPHKYYASQGGKGVAMVLQPHPILRGLHRILNSLLLEYLLADKLAPPLAI